MDSSLSCALRPRPESLTTDSNPLFSGDRDGGFFRARCPWTCKSSLGDEPRPFGLCGTDDLHGQRQAVREHPGRERFVHVQRAVTIEPSYCTWGVVHHTDRILPAAAFPGGFFRVRAPTPGRNPAAARIGRPTFTLPKRYSICDALLLHKDRRALRAGDTANANHDRLRSGWGIARKA